MHSTKSSHFSEGGDSAEAVLVQGYLARKKMYPSSGEDAPPQVVTTPGVGFGPAGQGFVRISTFWSLLSGNSCSTIFKLFPLRSSSSSLLLSSLEFSDTHTSLSIKYEPASEPRHINIVPPQVVTTPGVGFGPAGQGFVRISAFGQRANVVEACARLTAHFKK